MPIALMTTVMLIYFFFSSRRRHTRSKRDWSSDVCSSDLANLESALPGDQRRMPDLDTGDVGDGVEWTRHARERNADPACPYPVIHVPRPVRSEERRVGKERRVRRWTYE